MAIRAGNFTVGRRFLLEREPLVVPEPGTGFVGAL